MKTNKRSIYFGLLIVSVCLYVLIMGFFLIFMQGDPEHPRPQGDFLTPGDSRVEWMIAIGMIPVTIMVSGIVAIYSISYLFLKGFIRLIGTKRKLGLVPTEELSRGMLLRKLLGRAIILGFFACNVSYTLASQIPIIYFIRIFISPEYTLVVPDPDIMFQLVWIIAIPCTLIIVPIWLMLDLGLVSTSKTTGVNIDSVNLVTNRLNFMVKGYAGVGFLYNLIVMILSWISGSDLNGPSEVLGVFMRLISPILVISFTFPLIILIDSQKTRFNENLWKIMKDLGMNNRFVLTTDLEPVENYDDI
ncbi:MAG: hypothetical protein ACFFCZ_21235 [Promethearchaeota archaeon]